MTDVDDDPADANVAEAGGGATTRAPGFAAALRVREFRALWAVDAASIAGDQFARVALSVLVFSRTGSVLATAAVYALTFVPTLVGGLLLSGVADRYPRKHVMVAADTGRAVLLAAMAIPELPLPVLCVLLVVAVLLGAPFRAAQTATLPDVLPGEQLYAAGLAVRATTLQAGQLLGFGIGGLVVAVVDPHVGLLIDAATFAVSAVVVAVYVRRRPAPERPDPEDGAAATHRDGWWRDLGAGIGTLNSTPALRVALGLTLLAGLYVVPEGLAAPYAASVGGGAAATGLLLAADPAGAAFGAWLFVRGLRPPVRERWMAIVAVVPGLVLLGCAARPGLAVTVVLWAVAGALSGYQVQTAVVVVREIPDARRGQVMGLVSAALLTVQGLGVLVAGAVGQVLPVADVVTLAGGAGAVLATVLAWRWSRVGGGATDRARAAPRAHGAKAP